MRRKRAVLQCLTVLLVAGLAAGCATPKFWAYQAKAQPVSPVPLLDRTVAVPPFVDARPDANADYLFLHLIPFMPLGWQNLETPEKFGTHVHTGQWEFDPAADLARALAEELTRARLFRMAVFTRRPQDYDLVLEGKVISTRFTGFRLSYGLSVAAPAVWVFGLPSAHITNRLELVLVLKDAQTGRTLWSGEYLSEIKGLNGLYYDRPDFYYGELLADLAQEIIANLEDLVRAAMAAEAQ